jgi:hypothetical protein
MIDPAGAQQVGIAIPGVDRMDGREQAARGQGPVNRRGHGDIGQARRRGLDIRDQVRPVGVTGLGQMDLRADPADVARPGGASLRIIGRVKTPAHWRLIGRLIGRLAPADTALVMGELLDPDEPQPLHGRRPIRPEAVPLVQDGGQ